MTATGGWRGAGALAALGALLYVGTLDHDYVLDDPRVVRDHPVVNEGRFGEAWTTPYWPAELRVQAANWRPLATASWTLERALAGPPRTLADGRVRDPALPVFHGVNALLHGACVLALFALGRRWLASVRAAWVAAALFAVHPAHTEAVAPVVGRIDLLAGLGGLLLLEWWGAWRATGRARWLVAATLAWAGGALGKESVLLVPLVLPLVDRVLCGVSWRALRERAAWDYAPLLGVGVAYAAARVAVLGPQALAHAQEAPLGALGRLGFIGRNTWISLGLLVAPVRFHHILTTVPSDAPFTYPAPGPVASVAWALAALPVWLGWLPLARRAPLAAVCWVAALACFTPSSGVFPAAAGVALRFLFLPTAFAAIAAVSGGRAVIAARPAWRGAVLGVGAAWAVGGLALTLWRTPHWRDPVAFHAAVLREVPGCYTARYSLGAELALAGAAAVEVRSHFEQAVAIAGAHPISVPARRNLAATYEFPPGGGPRYGAGADLDRACALYADALRLVPDAAPVHLDLAQLHEALRQRARTAGDHAAVARHAGGVAEHLAAVLATQPDHPEAPEFHMAVADCRRERHEPALALPYYRAAAAGAAARAARRDAAGDPAGAGVDRGAALRALDAALACGPSDADAAAIRAERSALGR